MLRARWRVAAWDPWVVVGACVASTLRTRRTARYRSLTPYARCGARPARRRPRTSPQTHSPRPGQPERSPAWISSPVCAGAHGAPPLCDVGENRRGQTRPPAPVRCGTAWLLADPYHSVPGARGVLDPSLRAPYPPNPDPCRGGSTTRRYEPPRLRGIGPCGYSPGLAKGPPTLSTSPSRAPLLE